MDNKVLNLQSVLSHFLMSTRENEKVVTKMYFPILPPNPNFLFPSILSLSNLSAYTTNIHRCSPFRNHLLHALSSSSRHGAITKLVISHHTITLFRMSFTILVTCYNCGWILKCVCHLRCISAQFYSGKVKFLL